MDHFKTEDYSRRALRRKVSYRHSGGLVTPKIKEAAAKLEFVLGRHFQVSFLKVKYFRLWQVKFLKEDINQLKIHIKKTNCSLLAWAFRNFNFSKQAKLRHAFYFWRLLKPLPRLSHGHMVCNAALVILAAHLKFKAAAQAKCNFARPAASYLYPEWGCHKQRLALWIWKARTWNPSPYLLRNVHMLSQTVSPRKVQLVKRRLWRNCFIGFSKIKSQNYKVIPFVKALKAACLKRILVAFTALKPPVAGFQETEAEGCWRLVACLGKASPVLTSFLKLKEVRRKPAGDGAPTLAKLLQFVFLKRKTEAFVLLRSHEDPKAFDIDSELISNHSNVLQTLEAKLFSVSGEVFQLRRMNSCWSLLGSFERRMRHYLQTWDFKVRITSESVEGQSDLFEYLRVLEAKVQMESIDDSTYTDIKERLDRSSF